MEVCTGLKIHSRPIFLIDFCSKNVFYNYFEKSGNRNFCRGPPIEDFRGIKIWWKSTFLALSKISRQTWSWDRRFGGSNVADIFGDPKIGLFLSTCCRTKFLAPGDPPGILPKKWQNEGFPLKNVVFRFFPQNGGLYWSENPLQTYFFNRFLF